MVESLKNASNLIVNNNQEFFQFHLNREFFMQKNISKYLTRSTNMDHNLNPTKFLKIQTKYAIKDFGRIL
jgi:hypothetical protein